MRRCKTECPVRKAAGDKGRAEKQSLGHGGAGAVKPQIGHAQPPYGKGAGNTLIEQVAASRAGNGRRQNVGLGQGVGAGQLDHALFGFLPGFLPEAVVGACLVKACPQRAFALFFAAHGGAALHPDGLVEKHRVTLPPHAAPPRSQKRTP